MTLFLITSVSSNCLAIEVLRVGFGINKPPYIFEREKTGFEVEIFEKVAASMGYKFEPIFAPMERLKIMISDGYIDVLTNTNSNESPNLNLSDVYIKYQNYAIALSKNKFKIKKIDDLKNYSIGSFQRAKYLLGDDFYKMASNNKNYAEYAKQNQRNLMLFSERVQVVIGDKRIFDYFSSQLNKKESVDYFKVFPMNYYLAGFKSIELMNKFNKGLKKIYQNGEYKKIEMKYSNF